MPKTYRKKRKVQVASVASIGQNRRSQEYMKNEFVKDATTSENVKLARRFVEGVLGGQDPNAFNEIVDDNVWVSTGLKPDAPITGKAEYGKVLGETLGKAFSDGRMKIDDIAETTDGRVLVRFTATVTHSGELYGVQPTGKTLTMAEIHLLRFRDGKLVENFVGALNPLTFEMLYAEHISNLILS